MAIQSNLERNSFDPHQELLTIQNIPYRTNPNIE